MDKAYNELTQEEKDVLNKYTKLVNKDLEENLGTKPPSKEYAQSLKKFIDLN